MSSTGSTRTPDFTIIGHRRSKVDAWPKVTGRANYADDLPFAHLLYARLLRSPHAHARIRAIDATRALAVPGVTAVISGADLPVPYGILPVSQDEHGLAVDKVRFVGDPVAAIAAEDEETADHAMGLIVVDYDVLTACMTVDEALSATGDPIHANGKANNVHKRVALEFGAVEAAFEAAAHVREDLFFYGGSNHLALEEHAAVAEYSPDGRLTLWSSTQTPHYVQRALAKALQLPERRVRVVASVIGGGFGGKTEALPHEVAAARLAMITGRPVKCRLSREEVFYSHRGRHPMHVQLRAAARVDGTLTGLHVRTVLDGGAYGSYGVASTYYSGALPPATYRLPAYRFEGARVFTNKPPCGPKRGHGTPQPRFGLEVLLDKLAEDLGLDPLAIRLKNLVAEDSVTVNHLRVTSCGLRACLERVADASGFLDKHRRLPRGEGVGLAASCYLSGAALPIYWNGLPHTTVHIQADRTGTVHVACGATDIGQGSDSVLASLVAEVLGLDLVDIQLDTADTALAAVDLGSYSSRVTFMMGNAALRAAENLREQVLCAVGRELHLPTHRLILHSGQVALRDERSPIMSWPDALQLTQASGAVLAASGTYAPPPLAGPYKGAGVGPSPAYSYSACVVHVNVDAETGQVVPSEVWLAHDGGRALNPTQVEGQIEGGVYMGLGEALWEEQSFRGPLHAGPTALDYKTPTALDMPIVHCLLVETDDREGPFGAKEVGQGPLLPVPPAVANAVYDAVGVRVDEVPITPDKVLRALDRQARGQPARHGPRRFPDIAYPPLTVVEPPAGAPQL
ncbi:MAG: molybdopterin-dependent oxidoreductase [Ardenticatenales bacterium]|nr:molybdopterin-dependent oxidoreductase [Ardenticatenales bacterium]